MPRPQPNPKFRSRANLNVREREHYDVAAALSGWFDKARFVDTYRVRFADRNTGSIIPGDYCFNRDNRGNARYPRFLEWNGDKEYRFVDLNDSGSDQQYAEHRSARAQDFADGMQPAQCARSVEQTNFTSQQRSVASPSSAFPFDREAVEHWAARYWDMISERERGEERAFETEMPEHRRRSVLTKDMFVRLARWKSPRKTPDYLANSDEAVERASRAAFAAPTTEAAVEELTQLRGVALRTATALLHWMTPDVPILDFRVVDALGLPEPPNWESAEHFTAVAELICARAQAVGTDMRTLDRAMWAWQKGASNGS